jgi:hypothetical protein
MWGSRNAQLGGAPAWSPPGVKVQQSCLAVLAFRAMVRGNYCTNLEHRVSGSSSMAYEPYCLQVTCETRRSLAAPTVANPSVGKFGRSVGGAEG